MCTELNCKYKPDQIWCGYHDPKRYHKNGNLHKQRRSTDRSADQTISDKLKDSLSNDKDQINLIFDKIISYVDDKINMLLGSIRPMISDELVERVLIGVNNLLIKENSFKNNPIIGPMRYNKYPTIINKSF